MENLKSTIARLINGANRQGHVMAPFSWEGMGTGGPDIDLAVYAARCHKCECVMKLSAFLSSSDDLQTGLDPDGAGMIVEACKG